jgi:sporulation protein YabP
MNRQSEGIKNEHSFSVKMRKAAHISGVKQVISFDDNSVLLLTECGELLLEGSGLKVDELNVQSGDVAVSGEVSALIYTDETPRKKKRFFGGRE